jgi:hypothetical protein
VQFDALLAASAFSTLGPDGAVTPDLKTLGVLSWIEWASEHGLIGDSAEEIERVESSFETRFERGCPSPGSD